MPISTLRDIDVIGSVKTRSAGSTSIKVRHIPNLPQSDVTKALLDRIFEEFYPIIERRGYNVVSISEMCCCGDGMDYNDGNNKNNNNGKRRKRRRTMGANVLGYNQSWGNKHSIHLRMRNPRNHAVLFPYEDIAGTMAHELAHCVHGRHDAKFYKLMDEIQEQHATLLARGLVVDRDGFLVNSGQSYTLGGSRTATKSSAAEAAEKRRRRNRWMPSGPQKLGGDSRALFQLLRPGEAAAIAAEERRLKDEIWCLPCQPQTVKLLDDCPSEQENIVAAAHPNKKNDKRSKSNSAVGNVKIRPESPPVTVINLDESEEEQEDASRPKQPSTIDLVDLTEETGDQQNDRSRYLPASKSVRPKSRQTTQNTRGWSCIDCTYSNGPNFLACAMCGKPRLSSEESLETAKRITIQDIKENEVRKSQEEFGFNIYGNTKKRSNQMDHIT